jgi:hypothetical protein
MSLETAPGTSVAEGTGATPTAPIFIVGTSRSGTTLLASMLAAHANIACGPETALFRNVPSDRRGLLDDPAWPDEAARFLSTYARPFAGPALETYGLDADQVRRELIGKPRSMRSMLEAMTVPWMRERGKRRWAEKTPGHLLHVRGIRRLWPDAAIIRVIRDPRAVAASYLKVPFGPDTAVGGAYLWRMNDEVSRSFFESDRNSVTVLYEDLVGDPEAVLRKLCASLGEPFDPHMLTPDDPRSTVVVAGEFWKDRVSRPVDSARASAWRQELSVKDQERVALVCGEGMRHYGYEGGLEPRGHLLLHPYDRALSRAGELLGAATDRGILVRPADDQSVSARIILWGTRGQLRWTRGEQWADAKAVAGWGMKMLVERLRGRPVRWLPEDSGRPLWHSPLERTGDLLVRVLGRRVDLDELKRQLADQG